MYHQIDEPPPRGSAMRGLVVAPESFARQMGLLKLLGYTGLSMRDLEPFLRGEKRGKVVGLTFDDGYANNVRNALPVLKRRGFTATCYGVSAMFGRCNSWDEHLGIAQKPLMDAQDWLRWRDAGMDIGSHTCTHAALTKISPDHARQEIVNSKTMLENALGCEVRHFCYPYGWYGPEHLAMVKEAGYVTATTTHRGRVHFSADLFTLRRIMVARATHLGLFAAKVFTRYEDNRA
jgi:peptidoglycan/xylan/chitin deacetylase (PgdA/CDA1 family)